MNSFKILSLDGGGVRSLFQAILIKRLDAETNFLEKTDYFVGTSAGAIVSAGLAFCYHIDMIIDLFKKKSNDIFYDNIFDNVKDIFDLVGAKYSNKNLKKLLSEIFADSSLGDLKKKILITSFILSDQNYDSWGPRVFHNFDGFKNSKNMSIVDAVF